MTATDPINTPVIREGERRNLSFEDQMRDAQSRCVPCKLCDGAAVISDAGTGAGYYIRCENSMMFRRSDGCLITDQRLSGWAYNVMDWWNRLHAVPSRIATEGEREEIARIIDPMAWGEIGHDDYLRRADEWAAQGHPADHALVGGYRNKAKRMVESSLTKADAILARHRQSEGVGEIEQAFAAGFHAAERALGFEGCDESEDALAIEWEEYAASLPEPAAPDGETK